MAPLAARSPVPPLRVSPPREEVVQALVSEFREEKKKERDLEARIGQKRKRHVGTAVAAVFCVAAWLAPVPKPRVAAAPLPARFSAASARLTLTLAGRRIETFRTLHGRLPSSLLDAGVHEPRMSYERGDGASFVIRIPLGDGLLAFDSSMSPALYTEDIKSILATTGR